MVEFDVAVHLAVEVADILMVAQCVKVTLHLFKIEQVLSAARTLNAVETLTRLLLLQLALDLAQSAEKVAQFIFKFGNGLSIETLQSVHDCLLQWILVSL